MKKIGIRRQLIVLTYPKKSTARAKKRAKMKRCMAEHPKKLNGTESDAQSTQSLPHSKPGIMRLMWATV
jgi:hypothetical protein